MATDVDIQYFSHLNGLTLGNNWGDLIRLLDKALVTGIDFTQITAASIDAQGDVHITLYSDHNAMLFQVVELTGFAPASFNQKYRIKGVPNTTQLILKPHAAIAETSITTVGAGKLASLGYEIIFRDTNDVKRVYRAKNPTAQHPFIRVDESLTSPDGTTGVYTSTYAKYAMVGLLEHMEHIDDYENPDVLQLPFDPADPAKNWKITGTGTNCVRGWSRWVWARSAEVYQNTSESSAPSNGNRAFTLCGNTDAFYINLSLTTNGAYKRVYGTGLFKTSQPASTNPNWFIATYLVNQSAGTTYGYASIGGTPFGSNSNASKIFATNSNLLNRLMPTIECIPIVYNYGTGNSGSFNATSPAALEIPFFDTNNTLRGTIAHCLYSGNNAVISETQVMIAENSMYIRDASHSGTGAGGAGHVYYYLGELG
ncbi:hypothetical protein [Acinetobacter sp. ANC 5045]|uniref:hypothetical protein n=1 Tax=Acinetobacter sp. ANC 5045 TaxID=2529851 RepID=UPI00103E57EB|nr:hypothetical protein [Acinetobacter sp. ANC 5045]TCB20422.1 hypothetical protein E0H79_03780 [Acinetobacter sp. ANC 5045]